MGATRPIRSSTFRKATSSPTSPPKSNRSSSSAREGGGAWEDGPLRADGRRRIVSIDRIRCVFDQGLVTKSEAPFLSPSTASGIEPQAVIRITGVSGRISRMRPSSSSPSRPLVSREKFMSWRTRSNRRSRRRASASSGSPAAACAWPCRFRSSPREAVTDGSSSMMRITIPPPGARAEGPEVTRSAGPPRGEPAWRPIPDTDRKRPPGARSPPSPRAAPPPRPSNART